MLTRIHPLARLAGATALATLAVLPAAGSAQAAAPWWNDPNTCTNHRTVATAYVQGRTVEVRTGICGGKQHGWGRIRGYDSGAADFIRFEVDINGDRRPDGTSWYLARDRNYTAAYPTSTSSAVAFRACYVTARGATCNDGNSTRWW